MKNKAVGTSLASYLETDIEATEAHIGTQWWLLFGQNKGSLNLTK